MNNKFVALSLLLSCSVLFTLAIMFAGGSGPWAPTFKVSPEAIPAEIAPVKPAQTIDLPEMVITPTEVSPGAARFRAVKKKTIEASPTGLASNEAMEYSPVFSHSVRGPRAHANGLGYAKPQLKLGGSDD